MMETENIKETLHLAKDVFEILLKMIIHRFKEDFKVDTNCIDSQLYGFGKYDSNKPNLKNELESVLKGYVNGKYLYNKYREVSSGKPIIKISREYKYLFFKYLGYKNINEFINQDFIKSDIKNKQLNLLDHNSSVSEDYYYVCHYLGENDKMNKGQATIYNQWKTVEMKYVYEEESGLPSVYTFFGNIVYSENFVHFNTKFFSGNKKIEGAKFIFFVGRSTYDERYYLIGTYAGFDKYDRAIAGKMILKKCSSKSKMEEEVINKNFDPLMSQELKKNRIVIESNLKRNPLMFSKRSPYAQVLFNTVGNYRLEFIFAKNSCVLELVIQKNHYNIVSLIDSIIIEDDEITVLNKGKILNLDFSISGVFDLQKVSIYIKSIDFVEPKKGKSKGSFNGVDINNNIISGDVMIT